MEKAHADKQDWDLVVPLDLLKQREATQNIFTIVMSSIASISLIVGGIGIMNIMLASVLNGVKRSVPDGHWAHRSRISCASS